MFWSSILTIHSTHPVSKLIITTDKPGYKKMHDIVGRAWPNTRAEHGTVTCIWNHHNWQTWLLENAWHCGASLTNSYMHMTVIRMRHTSGHRNHTKYTRVYTGTVPGWNTQACCTQAGPAQVEGRGNGMDRW